MSYTTGVVVPLVSLGRYPAVAEALPGAYQRTTPALLLSWRMASTPVRPLR